MNFFFKPRGIAVIGATPNPLKGGHAILRNLILGYTGRIYPVNPNYPIIEGLPCYPSVDAIPGWVDLAIVFIPAAQVPAAVEDCAAKGIPGVMVESGGFAETGPAGARLQSELAAIAKRTGIRIWGPNCMGLVDAVHRRIFSFMDPKSQERGLLTGEVSLIVQSGMLSAGFLVDITSRALMGISKVCSVGNKVDVNECDLLSYLLDDPDTRVIGLYLESFAEGRRFLDLARLSRKPIVVLKGGKSGPGARAAMSHTASLAGNSRVAEGALAQAGVVEARDFKQMIDLCRTLAVTPARCTGRRVAILTFSGGAGIVATDFLAEHGLELAELAAATRRTLEGLYPRWMPVANPVDLWPAIERHIGTSVDVFTASLSAVLDDPGVDAVFLHLFVGNSRVRPDLAALAARVRAAGKPIVVWILGHRDEAHQARKEALAGGIPLFSELERAAGCLAAALGNRRRPEPAGPGPVDVYLPDGLRRRIAAAPSGPLDEHDSKTLLAAGGIPTVAERLVTGPDEAVAAAAALGYPVVMKGLLPGQIHKTEQGLVRLGVGDARTLRQTYAELEAAMHREGKVLIQRLVRGRVEMILGLTRDAQFGPCVMFGLGGVAAEVVEDVRFAVAPVSQAEALRLIDRIRGRRLLDGFRGAPPVERDALARLLIRLGEIGLAEPRIREIDINPLIAGPDGLAAVDATIVLN